MKISFSFLVLEPVQSFMDILFIVIVFFLVDCWRKSHVSVILIFYSLFEGIGFFVGFCLMVGLWVQKLFEISWVLAFASIDCWLKGAISHGLLLDLCFEASKLLPFRIEKLLRFMEELIIVAPFRRKHILHLPLCKVRGKLRSLMIVRWIATIRVKLTRHLFYLLIIISEMWRELHFPLFLYIK